MSRLTDEELIKIIDDLDKREQNWANLTARERKILKKDIAVINTDENAERMFYLITSMFIKRGTPLSTEESVIVTLHAAAMVTGSYA